MTQTPAARLAAAEKALDAKIAEITTETLTEAYAELRARKGPGA